MTEQTIDVRARELREGDWLIGSQRRVVYTKVHGPRVIVVVSKNGRDLAYEWNSSTTMRIVREVR